MRSYILASFMVLSIGTPSVFSQHGLSLEAQVTHHVQLQENGKIFGKMAVEYVTGKAVPVKAIVEVFKDETRLVSTRANERGEFHFEGLAPGSYSVTSEVGGKSSDMRVQIHAEGTDGIATMLSGKIAPTLDEFVGEKSLESSTSHRFHQLVYEAEATHDDIVQSDHIHFVKGEATWVSSSVNGEAAESGDGVAGEAERLSVEEGEPVVVGGSQSAHAGGFVDLAKSPNDSTDLVSPTVSVRATNGVQPGIQSGSSTAPSQGRVSSLSTFAAANSAATPPVAAPRSGASAIAAPTVPVIKTDSPDPLTDLFELPDFQAASPAQ